MLTAELAFKAKVVAMILSKETEKALALLSSHYGITEPKLKVGMPKRYSRNPACYEAKTQVIHVSSRKILWNPHVILHEFYHHLRNLTNAQGGIEKYAKKFSRNYVHAYRDNAKP